MIVGIGFDVVEMDDMAHRIEAGQIMKVFSPEERGHPVLRLGRDLRTLVPQGSKLHLSLSHTCHVAGALVIIESEQGTSNPCQNPTS